MDENYIIVTINGINYYIAADRLNDLAFIDNKLVNISNSSINLVNNFEYNNQYPRIQCNAMSQCILRSNSTSSYSLVTSNYSLANNQKFNINTLGSNGFNTMFLMLLSLIVMFNLIWKK